MSWENKTYLGNIFLEEDNFITKYPATLIFQNNIIYVEFQNKLIERDYDIIKGEFIDLGFVTLIECRHSNYTSSIVSFVKYRIQHIVTEIKFNSLELIKASSILIDMPILKDWINTTSLSGNLIFNTPISYSGNKSFNLFSNDEFEINANLFLKQYNNVRDGIKLKEYAELEIKCKNDSISIFDLLQYYRRIKLFFNFLGFFSNENDKIYLKEENILFEHQDSPIIMKLYTSIFNSTNKGTIYHHKIYYEDIKESLNSILSNWIYNDLIQDSINLIMEKYLLEKLSVETYFLNTAFALETYHRNNINNKVYEENEFEIIKKGLIEKIFDCREMKLFLDKLQYANEPSFRNRLKHFSTEIGLITNKKTTVFINEVVETRNYLVHRGKPTKNVLYKLDLYFASIQLESLTKLYLLKDIGLSKDTLHQKFVGFKMKIENMIHLNSKKEINKLN